MLTRYDIESLKLSCETVQTKRQGILAYFADSDEKVQISKWQLAELIKTWESVHVEN